MATQTGHKDVVELLLDRGAAVEMGNTFGAWPLYMACQAGHKDLALLLLDKGAAVDKAIHLAFNEFRVWMKLHSSATMPTDTAVQPCPKILPCNHVQRYCRATMPKDTEQSCLHNIPAWAQAGVPEGQEGIIAKLAFVRTELVASLSCMCRKEHNFVP
eukprot:1156223-Pelagomonas_calceolata.AAC.1